MTNDEIRLKIAKLKLEPLGWCVINSERGWFEKKREYAPGVEVKKLENTPNWPENVADAWGLFEELSANHFSTKLMTWDHVDNACIILHHRQGHDENISDDEIMADTAPRAICLAWIAWKESQK